MRALARVEWRRAQRRAATRRGGRCGSPVSTAYFAWAPTGPLTKPRRAEADYQLMEDSETRMAGSLTVNVSKVTVEVP